MGRIRHSLGMSAAAAALTYASFAHAETQFRFDIPAGLLAESIRAIGKITGRNVIFDASSVSQITVPPLKGEMTADQALAQVLKGSHLAVRQVDERSTYLVREDARRSSPVDRVATNTVIAQAEQPAASPAPIPATPNSNALEEVVVTATRQTSTVNKVALSVSAVTQKSLDQQGIRSVADLSNQVPGFTFRNSGGDSVPLLTIRGIGGNAIATSSGGAPTTGVYIDDVALQKRNLNGVVSGSGTPAPLLYDLDRIEVLRGPQGTLYGGSSEGGTLRFITPTPSLTNYSGSARLGVNTVAGGGIGDEEGIALGGPIVQDKLGFRIAGFSQDRAGWINNYSELDGHETASQVNKGNDYSIRASLLWQVTPDFKMTVSVINQMNYDQDTSTVRTSSPAINVPLRTLANTGIVQGVAFSFPATTFGGYTVPATPFLSNSARNGSVNGLYLTPTDVEYAPSPHRTMFTIPSVTLDYNWHDKIAFKSVTADDSDETRGDSFSGGGGERTSIVPYLTNQPCPSGTGLVTPILTAANACMVNTPYLQFPAGSATNPTGAVGPANFFSNYFYRNQRNQVTEEIRVSTVDPPGGFNLSPVCSSSTNSTAQRSARTSAKPIGLRKSAVRTVKPTTTGRFRRRSAKHPTLQWLASPIGSLKSPKTSSPYSGKPATISRRS